MIINLLISSFITIFIAELGDKTQIATLTLSGNSTKPWAVFSRLDAYQLFLPAWWVLFGDGCLKTRLGAESNKKIDNSTKILHYYINFCFRNCTCSIPYSISSDI